MDNDNIYAQPEYDGANERTTGKKAGSAVISVFLFAGILSLLLLVLARQIGSRKTIRTVVREFDVANMDITELVDSEEQVNLTDYVYNELTEYEEFKDVSKDDIREFLDNDVADYFSEVLGDYADVIYSGEGSVTIDVNEIVDIIEKSDNEMLKDVEITPEVKEELKASIDELNISKITTETIIEDENIVFIIIRNVTSDTTLIIVGAVILLLAVLLILVNRRYTGAWMLHISVPAVVAGVVLVIAGAVVGFVDIKSMISGGVMADAVIEAVQSTLSGRVFIISGITLAIGAVFAAGAGVIAHFNKKSTDNG